MAEEPSLVEIVARIVASYLANNRVSSKDIPDLMLAVHDTLAQLRSGSAEPPGEALKPAVPIKRSVTEHYIVCLEDGLQFKSLKRHLRSAYGMTPEQYRVRWGLPHDYPMVAPAYAAHRSQLAKQIGLGRRRNRRR